MDRGGVQGIRHLYGGNTVPLEGRWEPLFCKLDAETEKSCNLISSRKGLRSWRNKYFDLRYFTSHLFLAE